MKKMILTLCIMFFFVGCTDMNFNESKLSEKTAAVENDWKNSYKAILETFKRSEDHNEYSMFSLLDINGDDIPELIISEGMLRASSCHIYSCHNGTIYLGEYGSYGEVVFKPDLNLISTYDIQCGYEYFFYYSFGVDFSLVMARAFYNDRGAAGSPEKTEYKIDNKLVSSAEYYAELENYQSDEKISLGRDHSFTDGDILSALSEYK